MRKWWSVGLALVGLVLGCNEEPKQVGSASESGNGSSTRDATSSTLLTTSSGPSGAGGGASTNSMAMTFGVTTASGGSGTGASNGGGMAGADAEGSGGNSSGHGGSGSMTPVDCAWNIEDSLSDAIATVGIVQWSNDLEGLTEAFVEFRLNDPEANDINLGSGGPVSIEGATHRALLLGLKQERSYTYRLVARAGAKECTSPERTLTTGRAPDDGPTVLRDSMNPGVQERGFIVTSVGFPLFGGFVPQWGYVIDADGDIVWWAPSPTTCSRALMSWDGASMWMVSTQVTSGQSGYFYRVSMDGMETQEIRGELAGVHHDFTVLPDGAIAALAWADLPDSESEILELHPDGSTHSVAIIDRAYHSLVGEGYHANSIQHHDWDDTYTVSDRQAGLFLKLDRDGELLWQFGGSCNDAPAAKCVEGAWGVQHGHHLRPDGRLLFFNNSSSVHEYQLTESAGALQAQALWSYVVSDVGSPILGDAQRLPNGNILISYSSDGQIREVTEAGEVVQLLTTPDTFGYINFRRSLYGPPLR